MKGKGAKNGVVAVLLAIAIGGCASNPNDLHASHVSSARYSGYNCDQLNGELKRVSGRETELYAFLKNKADNDRQQFIAGLFFWPVWFLLEGGDGPLAAEYSRLKGEQAALEGTIQRKDCPPRPPASAANEQG